MDGDGTETSDLGVQGVPYQIITCRARARAILTKPSFDSRNGNKFPPQRDDGLASRVLTRCDGAWHQEMRRLADGSISGWLANAAPAFDRHFDRLLTELGEHTFEAVGPPFATAGPMLIADWIGVPTPDQAAFAHLCHQAFNAEDAAAFQEINNYLCVLVQFAAQQPEQFNGLLAALSDDAATDLTLDERIRFVRLFFEAGTDTLTSFFVGLLWILAEEPEWMAKLRGNPQGAWRFALDVLRRVSPIRWVSRTANQNEWFDGGNFSKGDRVGICLTGAAPSPQHRLVETDLDTCMSFGAGPHRCAGLSFVAKFATSFVLNVTALCHGVVTMRQPVQEQRVDMLKYSSAAFRFLMVSRDPECAGTSERCQ